MTTANEVIALVDAAIRKDVGYNSASSTRSKFDQNGWHGYWCARGISTRTMWTIGAEATNAAYGRQSGMTAGWAATWLWRDWFRANQDYPGLRNCRRGDILMMKFPSPSGSRAGNPTNHVEWIRGGWDNGVSTIGYNSVGTSGSGRPGEGATVSPQFRRAYIVGAYRPDWAAAARLLGGSPVALPTKFRPVGRTTKQVQEVVGVTPDGDYGPKTRAAVKAHQEDLTELGYEPGPADGLWGRGTDNAQEALMKDIEVLKGLVKRVEADVEAMRKEQGEFRDYVGFWFNKQWDGIPGAVAHATLSYVNPEVTGDRQVLSLLTEAADNKAEVDTVSVIEGLKPVINEAVKDTNLDAVSLRVRQDSAARLIKEDA